MPLVAPGGKSNAWNFKLIAVLTCRILRMMISCGSFGLKYCFDDIGIDGS